MRLTKEGFPDWSDYMMDYYWRIQFIHPEYYWFSYTIKRGIRIDMIKRKHLELVKYFNGELPG